MVLLDMVQAYSFSSCILVRYTLILCCSYDSIMSSIWVCSVLQSSGWWICRHTVDYFRVALAWIPPQSAACCSTGTLAIFTVVHMTASCLLPAYATYRNAQLMDSLLSYLSSKRHIVFSEPVITVSYYHSTFFLALTST